MKIDSLESYINRSLIFLSLLLIFSTSLLMWSEGWPWLWLVILETSLVLVLYFFVQRFRRRILTVFERASFHLDAINQEDFNQYAKSTFSHGKVKKFHQQLNLLSENLQQQKSRYDQHVFLVYQLIEQLDTPILVFNQKKQLTFGNAEFQHLFGQPWQMLRHASPQLLGLEIRENKLQEKEWQLSDSFKGQTNHQQWQIRQSEFVDNGETHQLLVFINIQSALRQSQLNAWQQIIRVLSHEIRNSLTPVSSLAESLSSKSNNTRDKHVLEVIAERCQHLQDFVDRYSSLSKNFQLSCQYINSNNLVERVSKLFENIDLQMENTVESLWVDGPFFEQVLINLIKNAIEAEATHIALSLRQLKRNNIITVTDNGHGFANLENSFVPLYTTKQQGQGIGLSFCRNIIEQHGGAIELSNNKDQGVQVTIQIPFPNKV